MNDLRRTLEAVVGTGKVGVPVALRLHLQVPDEGADLDRLFGTLQPLVESVFSSEPARSSARRNTAGRQLTVLTTHGSGQTSFVTVGRGSTETAALQVLLVGNHGIVRLEGDESFEYEAESGEPSDSRWRSAIERSIASGRAEAIG